MDRSLRAARWRHWAALNISILAVATLGVAVPTRIDVTTYVAATDTTSTALTSGLTLEEFDHINGNNESIPIHVLHVNLNEPTLAPKYLSSTYVTETVTLSTMGDNAGVVAAVNGDFFQLGKTNAPNGVGIADGTLRHGRSKTAGYNNAATFFPNGAGNRAALSQIFMNAAIALPGGVSLAGTNLNSPLIASNGIGVYNELWGSASRVDSVGTATSVREVEIRGGVVTRVSATAGSAVAADSTVLLGIGDGADDLASLVVGDSVGVAYQLQGADGASVAIGGKHILLQDGVVTTESLDRRPRTAVGFSADGLRMWMVTADQGASNTGLNLVEMGQLLKDLGADDALNLDGGGSTEMVARMPGAQSVSVLNAPSDGTERPIPNAIGFTRSCLTNIYSQANYMYTTANLSLPNTPLQARATSIGSWERFELVELGSGLWAIRSLVNGKYVTANLSLPDAPLQARATRIGSWEKFTLQDEDGYVAIKAVANSRYVTANLSLPDAPLQARAASIRSWEKFDISLC